MLRSSYADFVLFRTCLLFPNFLFVKNSSNCRTPFGYLQELTLFIFQCANFFSLVVPLSEQLIYYSIFRWACQYLFQNFFQKILRHCLLIETTIFISSCCEMPFRSKTISFILSQFLFVTVSRRQLYYITTFPPFCQHLFSSFSIFVHIPSKYPLYSLILYVFCTTCYFLYPFFR